MQLHSLAFLVLFCCCNVEHGSDISILGRNVLALSLSVSTAVILGLTRRGGDSVEILHDALQVLHLVVQLLSAVAVAGLEYQVIILSAFSHPTIFYLNAVSQTVTGPVLWVKNVRRPHLRHHGHRGEVEAPRVDGGRRGQVVLLAGGARQQRPLEGTRRRLRPD